MTGYAGTCWEAGGLIPGIWFELEVVNPRSAAWNETSHQLHRDGFPLEVGNRRFWDFRDPWVHAWLGERVIRLLRENGFGYLKIDCNDTLGVGCDGAESPGEGLRQHLAGVQLFLQYLRDELPDLVIENCAAGGHRSELSMLALTAMNSCSDAHDAPDVPIIAANVLPMVPAEQNQIWAVVRARDTLPRLAYTLAATFLGRMCLSGEVHELDEARSSSSAGSTMRSMMELRRLSRTTKAGPLSPPLRMCSLESRRSPPLTLSAPWHDTQ